MCGSSRFYFVLAKREKRTRALGVTEAKKLGTPFYYMPLRVSCASPGKRKKVLRG